MSRLRWLFAGFALALIASVALLVQRSLQSIALERQVRQQTIAERIFDEMERGLSDLLAAEEGRPTDGYASDERDEIRGIVIGRFEINAKEESKRNVPAIAGAHGELETAQADAVGQRDDLDEVARRILPKLGAKKQEKSVYRSQIPGTTVRVNETSADHRVAQHAAAPPAERKEEASDYAALRALNKGAKQRASERMRGLGYGRASLPVDEKDGLESASEVLDLRAGSFAPARMTGQLSGDDRLILYRTVVRDAVALRQGILLDVGMLGSWLREISIGTSWLSEYAAVELLPFDRRERPRDTGAATIYVHRFAEPFSDLSAVLTLRPLSVMRSTMYLYALSALVLAATIIGLGSLYRMVSLTVHFAERRSNFVAAVSHELKTPLTAIRMYGEMLRSGMAKDEGKRQEYYGHITHESERLSRLINNVLEFSELEKGTRAVDLSRQSLVPILEEVVQALRPHAREQGFEISLETEAELAPVWVEADALKQVVWNLADNAMKYGGLHGDPRIEISAERQAESVVVRVRDHGPGVSARQIERVFEPFYRAQNELTRYAKGSGLGLALVRGLVDKMGARVHAENAAGGGFRVTLTFPLNRERVAV